MQYIDNCWDCVRLRALAQFDCFRWRSLIQSSNECIIGINLHRSFCLLDESKPENQLPKYCCYGNNRKMLMKNQFLTSNQLQFYSLHLLSLLRCIGVSEFPSFMFCSKCGLCTATASSQNQNHSSIECNAICRRFVCFHRFDSKLLNTIV